MFNINQKIDTYMNLIVTHMCSRFCPFCVDPYAGKYGDMTLETVDKAIHFGHKQKLKQILITGGEPTLHPKIIEIAKKLSQTDFELTMTTNCQDLRVLQELDGYIDNFNFSNYGQPFEDFLDNFNSDITIHTIIHQQQLANKIKLDKFIDKYEYKCHLKFSTLTPVNDWCKSIQKVDYLDELSCDYVVLFNKIIGQIYRGCVIRRLDKIINPKADKAYKVHPDGTIDKSWSEV